MSTCPDTDLYSAYVDGEVPSPWREKLESHAASCPACRKHVERYRLIARGLKEGLAPATLDLDASFARLTARLAASPAHKPAESGAAPALERARDWVRYSVKLPVAALAAMFLAAVFIPSVAVAGLFGRKNDGAELAAARESESAALKSLAPTNDIYSPDLLTHVSQAASFADSADPVFTVVDYARKFSANEELFSDADIIIIKLPKLTGFGERSDVFSGTDDVLPLASGYDR